MSRVSVLALLLLAFPALAGPPLDRGRPGEELSCQGPPAEEKKAEPPAASGPGKKAEPGAQAVSYRDLLRLLELKIPEEQVLKLLAESPTRFTLDQAQEAELKKAGASDRVLAAIRGRLEERTLGDVTDIALVLDCSGSMADRTPDGLSRMAVAQKAVGELVDAIPNGRRLAFIVFGHDRALGCEAVAVVRPLGPLDDAGRAELKQRIAGLRPDGHTCLAKSLRVAGEELAKGDGLSGVIVVTDGMETCKGDPAAEAALLAKKLNLRGGVNVIGLAITPEERKQVEKIPVAGGKFYPAESATDLKKAFQEVKKAIVKDPGLPEGISLAKGLTASRWMTARRLTRRTKDDEKIINAKISAGGSHIIYATDRGVYVMDIDLRDEVKPRQLSAAPNGGQIDISADGKTVAWSDRDGLFVGKSDGSEKSKLPGGFTVSALRLTAAGDRVFVMSSNPVAIYSLPADGSDLRRVVRDVEVSKLAKPNTLPFVFYNFDVSDDGSHVVFRFSMDVFVVNGDGSDLRLLNAMGSNFACISGDGKTVAHYVAYGKEAETLRFLDWDGKEKGSYTKVGWPYLGQDQFSLARDGSALAMTRGLRVFRSDGKEARNPAELGGLGPAGHWPLLGARFATLTADFTRACVLVDRWEAGHALPQLLLIDFSPKTLDGVPALQDISVTPRFLANDGGNTATLTVKATGKDLAEVGTALLRDDARLEPRWGSQYVLGDEGKQGDAAVGDGVFTVENIRLTSRPAAGPFVIRLFAADKEGNMLAVDVEGVKVLAP